MLAGFHEVIYTEEAKEIVDKNREQGKSIWRVSSTMFTHFRYDTDCSPMQALESKFKHNAKDKY